MLKLHHQGYLYGPAKKPMLTPRGLCFDGHHLLISDTGQNRIFIYEGWPGAGHHEPALVLGQSSLEATDRNAGSGPSASSLHYPSGIWSDGKRLAVADAWNHRVLLWNQFPIQSQQPADVVLGQEDFSRMEVNRKGPGAPPSAETLYWPYGLTSDGAQLWIADTGNRRILHFAQWPDTNGAPADGILGQPDFQSRDYDPDFPVWPYSVKIGPEGGMLVADTQYYRVLYWPQWREAMIGRSAVLLGQPDFGTNGMNQYGLFPDAHTLNWVYDADFGPGAGLTVADTGNSRLLHFAQLPQHHSPAAHTVIGQPDFKTGSENPETVQTTAHSLYWPFALQCSDTQLWVADTGNHRVGLYACYPET